MRDIVSPISGFRSPFGQGRGLPALSLKFAQTGTLDSRITFSRASHATMFDSTGKLTYAPNNLFLNSATLSTQNVTTAAINYIISFKGTGTITLTGTSTAGPIVGTGVSDRVSLKITPTAGTLTCTVSGSVTEAQIEAVTYETTPRTYNPTTAAAYYGPRFDYDPVTLAAKGLLIEESRTNICLQSQAFSGAVWGSETYVTDNFATSPDGTNNAARVNNTGTIDNLAQTVSVTAGTSYTFSFYAKNNGGSTANYLVYNLTGGADIVAVTSYFSQINGSAWARISVPFTAPAGCTQVVIYVAASNDSTCNVLVWGAQLEAGAFATSYIPTTTASVTRAADSASMTGTNFSSWYNQSEGTFVVDAAGSTKPLQYANTFFTENLQSGIASNDWRVFNGTTSAFIASFGAAVDGVFAKTAVAYTTGASASAGTLNGAAPTDFTNPGLTATGFYIGGPMTAGQTPNYLNGHIKSISYYNTRLPNTKLQSLTA